MINIAIQTRKYMADYFYILRYLALGLLCKNGRDNLWHKIWRVEVKLFCSLVIAQLIPLLRHIAYMVIGQNKDEGDN